MAEKSLAASRIQAAFHEAIGRMESVVDQETALLRENRAVELTEYNHRKQQGLLEINRILRNFGPFDTQRVDREFCAAAGAQARIQPSDSRPSPQGDG